MDSKRTYIYNVVLQENDVCPAGELLTDKELERMKQHNPRRDLQATLRQMTIGKNANAVGWVIVTMYIFGPAPRELTSQECRKTRETNC